MAFDEVRLDHQYSSQAQGGAQFSTVVMVASGGSEQRQANWELPRYEWGISYDPISQATLDGLIDFFVARQGRARGFRFKDWTDYQMVAAAALTEELTPTTFQMRKQYVSGSITRHRKVRKPVNGTISVFKNDGTTPADANTIDYATGIITFTGGAPGYVPRTTGEFDVPVRFDVDSMLITGDGNGRAVSFKVVEVLED